jgi:hypothetical protein
MTIVIEVPRPDLPLTVGVPPPESVGLLRTTENVSLCWANSVPTIGTLIVVLVCPGAKVSVPLSAV